MEIMTLLYDLTESGDLMMAAIKPELPIHPLVDHMETKCLRLSLCFWSSPVDWNLWEYCTTEPDVGNLRCWPSNRKAKDFSFPTYPDVGEYSPLSLRVALPRKHGSSRWNCVNILFISLNMCY